MILFKQIRYRNFLSSGNTFSSINLCENPTTLIVGNNGAGKSTILDALCFVLFNKPFRKINKNQLVNSTNEKNCLVEIDFSIGSKEYTVKRGIKPNLFEIWIDGKIQDQTAATSDQQKQLEDSILKLNYKSFTQIVILGSASFVPFMQLSSANRREVVEDLLDIKIFSSMNSVIKEKIKKTNEKIKELSLIEKMTEEKIEMQKKFIENLDNEGNKQIESKRKKINLILKEVEKLAEENEEKENVINSDLQPSLDSLCDSGKKLKKLSTLRGKITEKISIVSEQHTFFSESTVCPTCTQTIDEKFRLNRIEELNNKKEEFEKGILDLIETIKNEEQREILFNQFSKKVISLNNEISNNNVKILQFNKQTRELEYEIQEIASKIKNKTTERNLLIQLENDLENFKTEKIKNKESISYLEFAHLLMKDGGIKAKIIKKYLPIMNQQINKYLQMMDFYINFNLDEEFKESIKTPIHEDFTYDSFSEGEKMRINLAILFTWREIARLKNSVNTNLLILDEVFDSSLDFSGTDYFSKIIRYVIKKSNIFVISHKIDELVDKFDKVIKYEKVKGFSKIVD